MRLKHISFLALMMTSSLPFIQSAQANSFSAIVKTAGPVVVEYGDDVLSLLATGIPMIAKAFSGSTNAGPDALREQTERIKMIQEVLVGMQSDFDLIHAALKGVDTKIETLDQDRIYGKTMSVYSDTIHLVAQIDSIGVGSLSSNQVNYFSEETKHLARRARDLIQQTKSTAENEKFITPDFVVAIGLLSQTTEILIRYQARILPADTMQILKGSASLHMADLLEVSQSLKAPKGLIAKSVSLSIAEYERALSRAMGTRDVFSLMSRDNAGFCAEIEVFSDTKMTPRDAEIIPGQRYVWENRETGEKVTYPGRRVTKQQFYHYEHALIEFEPGYIEIGEELVRIQTGIGKPNISQRVTTTRSVNNCDVYLNDRDLSEWFTRAQSDYNENLAALGPYALNVASSYASMQLVKAVHFEVERVSKWLN